MVNAKRQVFYSFHFDNDVMRVQQVRNMGVVEGDEPVSPNEWERLRTTDGGIKRWIDDNLAYRSCTIVLIGASTAGRPWINYEIKKSWEDKKGLFGIYIHNLRCPRNGVCSPGSNPFDEFTMTSGADQGRKLSDFVKCYNPSGSDAYGDIRDNLTSWVETAIRSRA